MIRDISHWTFFDEVTSYEEFICVNCLYIYISFFQWYFLPITVNVTRLSIFDDHVQRYNCSFSNPLIRVTLGQFDRITPNVINNVCA